LAGLLTAPVLGRGLVAAPMMQDFAHAPGAKAGDGVGKRNYIDRHRQRVGGKPIPDKSQPSKDKSKQAADAGHQTEGAAAAQSWMAVGPAQILTQSFGAVTGRVTSVAVDPSDATGNTVVVGTAGGGVWRSVNAQSGAATFVPQTDTLLVFNNGEGTASLSVGAVTVEPGGGTEVLLAGTGEARPVADARYGEGLLRSADNGQTWTLVAESHDGAGGNHSFTGEGFAGFAWGAANTVVAAVGQVGDAAQVGAVTLGASVRGLYGSTDAGQTWQLATIQDTTSDGPQIVQGPDTNYGGYDGNSALAVVWNPLRQMFYAVVQFHGVYGSPDGVTWTRLSAQPGPGLAVGAGYCPTDPGYAASVTCPVAQAAMAVNASTGDMFVWYVDANENDQGLWGDACGASSQVCTNPVTFSAQFSTAALENGSGQISDGTLGLVLAVMPPLSGHGGTLLAGADSLSWCNLSTGCAWQKGCAGALPFGMRSLAVMTAMQQVMIGNEGGLWRVDGAGAACSGSSFVNLNAGLGPIAQLESVAGTSSDAGLLLSGAADMGSAATAVAPGWSATPAAAPSWEQVQPGFGGDVVIDAAGGVAYATAGAGVEIARCAEGAGCAAGSSGFSAAVGAAQVESDEALAVAPYGLDPANAAEIVVGTCRVWRGPVDGAGWTSTDVLSPMLDGDEQASCNGNTLVRSVASGGPVRGAGASAESQVMYAGMQGLALNQYGFLTANAGQVFVTTDVQTANSSTAWRDIGLSPVENGGAAGDVFNVEEFDVSSVVVDAHDATGATVYATIYGFHVPHVYRSTDFGAHWWNVSANLPDVPVSAVAVDPNDANTVYVGLDTGVYFTQEIAQCPAQACWQVFGAGLPNAAVSALEADGGAVGLLRAATYGRGAWEIPLATGALANQTTATLSASSLEFAGQAVSTVSAPQNLSVTVAGANVLTLTSIVASGDFSETDNCVGVTVTSGSACTVAVEFAPSATGARAGSLVLYGNLPGGQAGPVGLSGTGLSPPQVLLSPSGTMGFGDEIVGETSAPQIVLMENTGQTAATLTGFSVSGAFAIGSNTCGESLAAQTGCSVAITFTPTARGAATGAFAVTDSAGTQQLGLTGTGEAAANLALSPASLTFGAIEIGQSSASEAITVTNSGDVSATVTGILATGDFSISGNSCGEAVAGNSSCGVSVKFLPTQTGVRTGLLTAETGPQTLTAQLSGTGTGTSALTLTPATLNFGPENLQQTSAAQTMTLTNTGATSNTVTSITTQTATLGTADYAVSSNCGVLAVGANCTITVTFTPSVAGPDAGTLTVAAANPGSGVTAALSGSGNTLSWTPGQAPSAKVPAGEMATYAVELRIDGYSGVVALSCGGLPAGAVCQLPQNVTAVQSMQAQSVMFSVATGPDVVAGKQMGKGLGMVLGLCLPVLFVRRRRWAAVVMLALLAGCGGSQMTVAPRTAPGSYTFTVTAAGGGMSSSMPVVLVVE
jgi:hypothetical protein